MKWTPLLFGSLTVLLIAGCGGERRKTDTGAAGTESGTMQGGAGIATDTAVRSPDTAATQPAAPGATGSDTSRSDTRIHPDTNAAAGKKQ